MGTDSQGDAWNGSSDNRLMTFEKFMDWALYGPNGYYTSSVNIGTAGGDFFTAAQSELFGFTLAQVAIRCWEDFGQPGIFHIVELGAGQGELAENLCVALERALPVQVVVHYDIVETSDRLRSMQEQRLRGRFAVTSRLRFSWNAHDKWDKHSDVLVIANEVLDALPVERLRRTSAGWEQALVEPQSPQPTMHWVKAPEELAILAERWLPIPVGTEGELCLRYEAILRQCYQLGRNVNLLLFDYGITYAEWKEGMCPTGTVRGYLQHRVVDPLASPGTCDITADVHWDYVRHLAEDLGFHAEELQTQGSFLVAQGIVEVFEQVAPGPTEPLRQANLAGQMKQLVLPGGMGERFSVLQCRKSG